MDPNDLRERVAEEIKARIDWAAWHLAAKTERAEKVSIQSVLDQWKRSLHTDL
jgi:hypothetical protein